MAPRPRAFGKTCTWLRCRQWRDGESILSNQDNICLYINKMCICMSTHVYIYMYTFIIIYLCMRYFLKRHVYICIPCAIMSFIEDMIAKSMSAISRWQRPCMTIASDKWGGSRRRQVCSIGSLAVCHTLEWQEEETEADVLGLLEFRECEMRQLQLSLGESVGDHRIRWPLLFYTCNVNVNEGPWGDCTLCCSRFVRRRAEAIKPQACSTSTREIMVCCLLRIGTFWGCCGWTSGRRSPLAQIDDHFCWLSCDIVLLYRQCIFAFLLLHVTC